MTVADRSLASVEIARDAILGAVAGPVETEEIGADERALGRVLAMPARATTALPPWDNSAMDGYAIRAADTRQALEGSPVLLRVVGEIRAGAAPTTPVGAMEAVRIATGARIPAGADAVIQVEQTTPADELGRPAGDRGRDASGPLPAACLVHAAVSPRASIRRAGSDLIAGAVVLDAGQALNAAGVTVAAGSGIGHLSVYRRPRVAVLATGDEVRPVGAALGPAGIPDANGPGLRSLVAAAGADPIALGIAADRLEDVRARLESALPLADAIVVSGGVSVGPFDVVRLAFEAIGRIELWRVAVQPGKPFAFGRAERPGGGPPVLLFGLPGNPVSGFVTFELFVRPAIRQLAGHANPLRPTDRAVLAEAVTKSSGRRAFLRVVAERSAEGSPLRDDHGRVRVSLAGGQDSHVMSALAAADALAVIPEADDRLPEGAEVELWWLDS